jgi:hypothetical protein
MIGEGDCGAIGGMKIGKGNRSTRRKPALAPLCPPEIRHDQIRARNRAAAVGRERLTAWAMARPCMIVYLRSIPFGIAEFLGCPLWKVRKLDLIPSLVISTFYRIHLKMCPSIFNYRMGKKTQFTKNLHFFLEFWNLDFIQKLSAPQCNIPPLQPFRIERFIYFN